MLITSICIIFSQQIVRSCTLATTLHSCDHKTCFRLLYRPLRRGQRVLTQRLIYARSRVKRRALCSTSSWGCELQLRTQKRSSCSQEAKHEWQLGHEARRPAIGGSPMQQAGLESQRLQPEVLMRSGTSLRIAAHNVAFRAKYSYKYLTTAAFGLSEA